MSYKLPLTVIQRYIKQKTTLQVPRQCLGLFQRLTTRFIKYIANTANQFCENEGKQFITPLHLFSVLEDVQGENKFKELKELLQTLKEQEKQRKKAAKIRDEQIRRCREEYLENLKKERQEGEKKPLAPLESFQQLKRDATVKDQLIQNYEQLDENQKNSNENIDL